MMIHMWMHWFWITTGFFRGFIFLAVQMISLSCIPHLSEAEAGLLKNDTLIEHNLNLYAEINSSQVESIPNITWLPTVDLSPPETTPLQFSPSSPLEEPSTESVEEVSRVLVEAASDIQDTHNGGTLDVFQYPIRKLTKYAKYGKSKGKGKTGEESSGEDQRVETVKIVEEKLNINISLTGDNAGRLEPVVDKLNDSLTEGNASEVPVEVGDAITTTVAVDNSTLEVTNATDSTKETFISSTTEEGSSLRSEETFVLSSTDPTKSPEFLPAPTEDQKDVLLKNESLVIENKVEESRGPSTVEPYVGKNRVAAAQNYEVEQEGLNAGSITGITLGILVVFSLFGAVSFVLYRRRYLNKPQVLHDKCSNLDSSGYIDDTSLRENSEEMYSLDNDSFLNSLEAMTIQNYWTENVKHTKL